MSNVRVVCLALLVGCWGSAGCGVDYPDGTIRCAGNEDCPSGFNCRAETAASSELFCFAHASSTHADMGTPTNDAGQADARAPAADGCAANAGAGCDVAVAGRSATAGASAGARAAAGAGSGAGTSASSAGTPAHANPGAGAGAGGQSMSAQAGGPGSAGRAAGSGASGASGAGAAGSAGSSGGAAGARAHCAADAQCDPGDMDTQPTLACGPCNSGTRPALRVCDDNCHWGPSMPTGTCANIKAECTPETTTMEARSCGSCGRTQSRLRTCSDLCKWDAPAFSACPGVECEPGASESQVVACPTCGQRTQTRRCDDNTCRWGAWTNSTACTWCEDCAEVQFCNAPSGQPNPGGTKCKQKACSREQALGDCMEDIKTVCGSVSQPFYMEYL